MEREPTENLHYQAVDENGDAVSVWLVGRGWSAGSRVVSDDRETDAEVDAFLALLDEDRDPMRLANVMRRFLTGADAYVSIGPTAGDGVLIEGRVDLDEDEFAAVRRVIERHFLT